MSENTQYNSNGSFQRKVQTEQESLHWISYNLKQLVAEMKNVSSILTAIKDKIGNVPF